MSGLGLIETRPDIYMPCLVIYLSLFTFYLVEQESAERKESVERERKREAERDREKDSSVRKISTHEVRYHVSVLILLHTHTCNTYTRSTHICNTYIRSTHTRRTHLQHTHTAAAAGLFCSRRHSDGGRAEAVIRCHRCWLLPLIGG